MSRADYVVVAGGVNIDIVGRSSRQLIPGDSNPGHIQSSLGGVGRNIAHNMSLLGMKVCLLTALGGDRYAEEIAKSCEALGIDITKALRVSEEATSTYLCIEGPDGETALAVSDMSICERISPEYLSGQLPVFNGAGAVVADGNLPQETILFLAEHCKAPVFADPVSVTKAEKLRPILGSIHTIKPNRLEAECLSGVKITDEASMRRATEKLHAAGVKRVFLSLGREGVFASDGEIELRLPCVPAEIHNTSGAGDAFMAALVWAWMEGMDFKDSTQAALSAAAIAAESFETVSPYMSAEAVKKKIQSSGGNIR